MIESSGVKWAGYVARIRVKRNSYRVLVGKPDRKRPLRNLCRWEDNIKMDLKEIGCGGMDWIDLARGKDQCRALMNTVINLRAL
jgi:hypothetical protein